MNKLKNILSHEENKSPSGQSTTQDTSDGGRRSSSSETTPSSTAGGDRTIAASGTLPSSTSASDRSATDVAAPSTTPVKAGNAVTHIREHAQPPAHHHKQPKRDSLLSDEDAKAATHDHKHLAPVTHEMRQYHEVEEVERQREVDRHVHHVQHHLQPVLDTQHAAEVHHEKVHPETRIRERHVATDEDKAMFAGLKTVDDSVVEAPAEKVLLDKGEKVVEKISHHVHHIVQPVIERDTHEHHRVHTVIPVKQTTHEAPIVHASVQHEPMSLKDFIAGGGDLKSTLKHDPVALLRTSSSAESAECVREVSGPGEDLAQQLGLSSLADKTASETPGAAARV